MIGLVLVHIESLCAQHHSTCLQSIIPTNNASSKTHLNDTAAAVDGSELEVKNFIENAMVCIHNSKSISKSLVSSQSTSFFTLVKEYHTFILQFYMSCFELMSSVNVVLCSFCPKQSSLRGQHGTATRSF